MQAGKKLADRFHPSPALESKDIECGHHQARSPAPAVFGFPQPRLGMAMTALHGLLETMRTALGQPRLLGKMAHALCAHFTKRLENPQTFRHCSEDSEAAIDRASNGFYSTGPNLFS